MQTTQRYFLTIRNLFSMSRGALCGAKTEVAILDNGKEIDQLTFEGKVGPGGEGYSRSYSAKPGLKAKIVSGPGSITMDSVLS